MASETDARRAALLASPLFQAMSPVELDETLRFASERRYPRGAMICQQGDEGSSMMAVLQGRVRVSAFSGEGREVALNVIGPGGLVGELALIDGKPRSNDMSAMEDTVVLIVERRHFIPFLRNNGDLALRMLVAVCAKLRATSSAFEELALFELPARLARLLLKLADDHGQLLKEGIRIQVKLSQGEIATRVASARETVNKQLKLWARDGLLIRDEAGYYVLCRPDMLRDLAG